MSDITDTEGFFVAVNGADYRKSKTIHKRTSFHLELEGGEGEIGRQYKRRIPAKDDGEPIFYNVEGEKPERKRFLTEEEYMRFRAELALTARKYDGFKKAVQFVEMKPVPDKLGLLILRESGKIR